MTHYIALLEEEEHQDRSRYRIIRIKRSVPMDLGYTDYVQHHLLTQFDREQHLRNLMYTVIAERDSFAPSDEVEKLEELANENELIIHILA